MDSYDGMQAAPAAARVEKKGHTSSLKDQVANARLHMTGILDRLMNGMRRNNKTIYTNYKNSRQIIDRGHGPGEAEPEAPE